MNDFEDLKYTFNKYRNRVNQRQGAYNSLISLRDDDKSTLDELQKKQLIQHKALLFLQSETIERRKTAKSIIENLGTSALQSIYDTSYRLELDFNEESTKKKDESHNLKMEFCIKNQRDKSELKTGLMGERGGGVVEVVSFSLRIAALNLLGYEGPLIIDEAYKSMSNDQKLDNVASFLRQIVNDLDRQVIFATHKDDVFGDASDKIFRVVKNDYDMAEVKEEYSKELYGENYDETK